MSKQALNQLLRSLEALGYLTRTDDDAEERAWIVRFPARERAAYARIHDILRDVEAEWKAELGASDFAQSRALLLRVWESSLVRSKPWGAVESLR